MLPNQFGFHGFIRKCFILAVITTSIQGFSSNAKPSSDEEAFLIRRIAEFWKDGDYSIVKEQIYDFIKKYPASAMRDYLQGILGDLCLQQNNYSDALELYSTIKDPALCEKIILNKLQCYYEVGEYEKLFKEGESYLNNTSAEFIERKNEYHFIMAESYFRGALSTNDEKQKLALINKATPFYEGLLKTEYEEVSSFALAEIYRLSKQNDKALAMYLSLSDKYPIKKESVLFNAALLESMINKTSSIELFDRVVALNGPKAGEAAFNRLVLYFQTEQYENVINQHRLVYAHVPDNQMALYHFIVGKSFFNIKDYESAILPLEKYILSEKAPSEQLKDALILQLSCAKQTINEPLFDKTLAKFKAQYPSDPELGKAYFMHAMLLKKEGNFTKAEQQLKVIFDQKASFDDAETLLYEYAAISHENQKYETSYGALKHFLKDFPASEKKDSAWRYFLSCCLHLSKTSETQISSYSKDVFLSDLQKVLHNKECLSEDELKEYRLLSAKLSYELSLFNESLEGLTAYIKDYPQDPSLPEAHLLTALSLSKLNADPESFCSHLETAVELSPELYNTSAIQLQLYNAYISRASAPGISTEKSSLLLDKASSYLYGALKNSEQPVKVENQLWLASYYYTLSKDYLNKHWTNAPGDDKTISAYIDRSLEIYSKIFSSGKSPLKAFDNSHLFLEAETLKYAELTGFRGHIDKKIAILKTLVEQQNKHKDWNWQFKRQALFELASTQEKLHHIDAALETYQVINEFPAVATPITTISALKVAKLKFDLLDKKQKNEKNPQVITILNELKDLQIRKNTLSEPTHLEAALEYVKIRTALSTDALKDSRYLFFLVRMKEDFTSSEDSIGNEYLSALKGNPSQENLYNAYMKFVDAEILRMQSKQLAHENKKEEAAAYKQKALTLLTEIENNKAPTEYLHTEITKSAKLLR